MKRKSEYQLIWEAYVTEADINIGTPDFDSRELDKLAGVDKNMPTSDVDVTSSNPLARMSIEELEDKLEKLQSEIARRKGADTEAKYSQAKELMSKDRSEGDVDEGEEDEHYEFAPPY